MTTYALREGVSYCRIGESNVFLDVVSDRYFCLQRRLNTAFTDLSEERHVEAELLHALRSSGIVVEAPTTDLFACSKGAPACLDDDVPGRRSTFLGFAGAIASRARWTWNIRHRSLSENIAHLVRRRQSLSERNAPPTSPQDLARAFRAASVVWPEHGRCLPTAMALFDTLVAAGHPARLVFGVHLTPFYAHCWVELGGRLVNDQPERICQFTPIRIV